jgi:hypothetical protein
VGENEVIWSELGKRGQIFDEEKHFCGVSSYYNDNKVRDRLRCKHNRSLPDPNMIIVDLEDKEVEVTFFTRISTMMYTARRRRTITSRAFTMGSIDVIARSYF